MIGRGGGGSVAVAQVMLAEAMVAAIARGAGYGGLATTAAVSDDSPGFSLAGAQMPCSYCGESGHNIRTCVRFDANKIAEMVVAGEAKQTVFRAMDSGYPGSGLLVEVIDRAMGLYGNLKGLGSRTKNERKRAFIALLWDVEAE
jgi:hypothetical protein